jgi:hypothetical protein
MKIDDCYITKGKVPKKSNKIDILDVIFKKDPIKKKGKYPIYIPNKIPQFNYKENKDSLKVKKNLTKQFTKNNSFKIISSYNLDPQYSYISSILIAISEKYRNIIARSSHSAENIIRNFKAMFDDEPLNIIVSLYSNFNIIVESRLNNGSIDCLFKRNKNCLIITLKKMHDLYRVVKIDDAYAIEFDTLEKGNIVNFNNINNKGKRKHGKIISIDKNIASLNIKKMDYKKVHIKNLKKSRAWF